MDPEQRRRVIDRVVQSIDDDYHNDFRNLFEQTLSINGNELPLQPSNDIRNFLDHLSLALRAEDEDEVERQIQWARKHLLIAKYDCLVISTLNRESYLDDYVNTLEDERDQWLVPLRSRLAEIKKARRNLPQYKFQPKREPEALSAELASLQDVVQQHLAVLNQCLAFQEYLADAFELSGMPLSSRSRRWARFKRWTVQNVFWIIIVGFIVNVLASMFYSKLDDWGKSLWGPTPPTLTPTQATPPEALPPASP